VSSGAKVQSPKSKDLGPQITDQRTLNTRTGNEAVRALFALLWESKVWRYGQFCLVGGTGVVVDMGVLWALASPAMLGWNLSLSKVLAAEVAIFNNFLWNDLWTFRGLSASRNDWRARWARLGKFNLICVAGIGWSVLLLNLQAYALDMNVYVANLVAIVIVSLWNYFMNLRFGWGGKRSEAD
jgi:dolichol-phosphate mannosyltransferase